MNVREGPASRRSSESLLLTVDYGSVWKWRSRGRSSGYRSGMARLAQLARNLVVRDWSIPVVVCFIGVVDIAINAHTKQFPGSPLVNVAFLLAAALPLGFRRFRPALVAVLTVAGLSAWDGLLYPIKDQASFEAFLLMLAASYIVGSDLKGRRLQVVTIVLAAWILPGWVFGLGTGESPGNVVPALAFTLLAWVVGYTLRRRKEQAAIERERADRLAFEQGRVAAEAVIEERSRIARELHDVIAHSLSVMVVQASAERRLLQAERSDVATTDAVLESVEDTGRAALVELRRLLGLLRRTDELPALAPQPSLRHLDILVAQCRDAGLRLDVEVSGDVDSLPAGVDLSAYRIVQEALTNSLKHAATSNVRLHVRRGVDGIDIEVVDDGGASAEVPSSGHGLVGMRERVTMYGGTLEVGPAADGGFRVHARLPFEAAVPAQR